MSAIKGEKSKLLRSTSLRVSAGTQLDQFYVQPVCSPTRAALMTGRFPIRYGLQMGVVRPWAKYGLPLEERLLPEVLKQNGYRTIICGKWHLGSFDPAYWPMQRGFDSHTGHLFGTDRLLHAPARRQLDWYVNGDNQNQQGYSTHLLTEAAVKAIEENSPDQPLFLYVPFNAVHGPYQVPEEYKKGYEHLKANRLQMAGMMTATGRVRWQDCCGLSRKKGCARIRSLFTRATMAVFARGRSPATARCAGKGTVYEGGVRSRFCDLGQAHSGGRGLQ